MWGLSDFGTLVHICVAYSQRPVGAFIKGSLHCDASVLVRSAECTVAGEVHCYRVDKRSTAGCDHAVEAHLIRGALTFYYKYLPQSLSPPFLCHCLSLHRPAFFLHLLCSQALSILAFPFLLLLSAVLTACFGLLSCVCPTQRLFPILTRCVFCLFCSNYPQLWNKGRVGTFHCNPVDHHLLPHHRLD